MRKNAVTGPGEYHRPASPPLISFMASSSPTSSVWQTRRRWLLAGAILVLGFVPAVPPSCWVADQVIAINFDVLDGSYPLDLAAHLSHGQLAGRDFIFTYGPLTQCLNALGLIVPPGDVASFLRFSAVSPC